ncbi:unnamed protein product, partial [Mesorhabditis spiculigera]
MKLIIISAVLLVAVALAADVPCPGTNQDRKDGEPEICDENCADVISKEKGDKTVRPCPEMFVTNACHCKDGFVREKDGGNCIKPALCKRA